jgi:two-component system chemotaxis sensor kinase CheA
MKLAYKVSLPLVAVIAVLIWFVTYSSNNTQREIIAQGQSQTEIKIKDQFEKNKETMIAIRTEQLAFLAQMIGDISMQHLYDMTFEKLKKPLRKFMEFEAIKAIRIIESIENQEVVFFGEIEDGYESIKREIKWAEDGEFLGTAEIFYDNSELIESIQKDKEALVVDIQNSNKQQDSYIESVIHKQNYSNLAITIVILLTILGIVYRLVINPLRKLKSGLDSFFLFLQNKTTEVTKIQIKSSDEFQDMSDSLDDNITITAELHKQIYELNTNLEQKVAIRTQELEEKSKKITQLLDNAAEGFLSFDGSLLVDSEYSKECERIFGENLTSKKIANLFYEENSSEKELFEKVLLDIFNPNIKEKKKRVFLNLLRSEFCINSRSIKVEKNPQDGCQCCEKSSRI